MRTGARAGWASALISTAPALAVGFGYAVWFQAVRAEVYALNLAMVLGVIYLLLRWERTDDLRCMLAAAFVAGLGLCNHHLLVVMTLPAAVGFVLLAWRAAARSAAVTRRRLVVLLLLAGVAGLLVFGYLPLRSRRLPIANWGAPHTVERFGWVVSARAFQKSIKRAARESVENRTLGALFAVMGGPPTDLRPALPGAIVWFLGVAGLYLAWRRRATRPAAALLTALVLLNLASPMLVGLDPFNPDAHGYLALSAVLVAPGIALAAAAALQALGRRRFSLLAVVSVLLALAGWRLAVNLDRCRLDTHWAAEENGRHAFAQAPGTLLFSSYFQTLFQSWSLRSTDDLRPDVTLVHRNFLNQPGYLETLAQREPSLRASIARWREEPRLQPRDLPGLALGRPVAVEYDINVGPALAEHLWPAGVTCVYGAEGPAARPSLAEHRSRIERWLADVGVVDDLETRRSLTWTHYLLARFCCERGLKQAAELHLSEGLRLAPRSRDLVALKQRCLAP